MRVKPDTVDWPSLFFALLLDSFIVWAPTVAAFLLVPTLPILLLLALIVAGLSTNVILYTRGATFGTVTAGFRLLNRQRGQPGLRWGLALSMLTLVSVPIIIVLAGGYIILNNSSGWPGDPNRYPIFGERTRRRRFLQAMDDYWERWAE